MTYTPAKTIVVVNDRLYESSDLTKPLSYFINKEAYLVVTENLTNYVLSLNKILGFARNLDLTQPVGTTFSTLLNDQFLSRYGTSKIPVSLKSGLYHNRLSSFNPLALKDYAVHFTSVNTPEILDDASRKGFLDDLVIISKHDMTHYLVSVNGVFHRTSLLNGKLYVLDGFRTIRLSGRKDIQIVDTKDVGGHTIIPLTKDNVKSNGYQRDAVVTLNQSVKGKTVFAVIDGYFYHRDQGVITASGATKLSIHTNKLLLTQQFKHNPRTIRRLDRYGPDVSQTSRKYTDAYERVFLNKDSVAASVFNNDVFQYSRLTTYHSFLVVINNANLYTVSLDAEATGTPQFYQDLSSRPISGMVSYGCGLSPSHVIWKDSFGRKYIFLSDQNDHADHQDQTIAALFVPTLTFDADLTPTIPLKFVDYVST